VDLYGLGSGREAGRHGDESSGFIKEGGWGWEFPDQVRDGKSSQAVFSSMELSYLFRCICY
jgi:hypothetical protein